MGNWYSSREAVKLTANLQGKQYDATIDRAIEAASRDIDNATRRIFIPITETRFYRWTNRRGVGDVLWLDQELLSTAPTVKTQAQDSTPTTLGSSEIFLEPINYGPPFNRIEINSAESGAFEAGDTPQRSISVAGDWGYSKTKLADGQSASTLSASGSTLTVDNGALIDVGRTLLMGTERIFVTERRFKTTTRELGATLNENQNSITVTLSSTGSTFDTGEVIRVDNEDMRVIQAQSSALVVERAWDGTIISTHNNGSTIHAYRVYDIERAANGSTAAAHASGSTIQLYEAPFEIEQLCEAEAIAMVMQGRSGWGRTIGGGEGAREMRGAGLHDFRTRVIGHYRRPREAAI